MAESLKQFLSGYSPAVRELALAARALVMDAIPEAIEQVDAPSKIIGYGYDRTYKGLVCAIAPYAAHVNLMFSKGATLHDPKHLLTGKGKHARHVRITTRADIDNAAVRALLKAAVAAQRGE